MSDEALPAADVLAELNSWQKVGGQMNRKLLLIMDVLDEMDQSESTEVLDFAQRLRSII